MKTLILIAMLLMSAQIFAGTPVLTKIPVDAIYVPHGFDSNDNTEIVISGYLPNLCHKSPQTSFQITGKTINITVDALRYDPTNPFCPEMVVPFIEPVRVGNLTEGTYNILVNGQTVFQRKAKVAIVKATINAVDDHVYANVEYVDKNTDSRIVTLKGHNPSDCFVLDTIDIVNNGTDTYAILPKMKRVSDFCPQKMVPFAYQVEIPKDLKEDIVLLHVRSMNGKAVNTVFPNYLVR